MEAGELRFTVEIERLDGNTWSPYAVMWCAIETLDEAEGIRQYEVRTRWTQQLWEMVGLRHLDKGFRVVWVHAGTTLYLEVDGIVDQGNRRRELRLSCHEIMP